MLGMEMALEAGLGIDSIKRVEILSALQDAHPELGDVDGDALAALRTLGDIVNALTGGSPSATQEAPPTNPSEGRLDEVEALLQAPQEGTAAVRPLVGTLCAGPASGGPATWASRVWSRCWMTAPPSARPWRPHSARAEPGCIGTPTRRRTRPPPWLTCAPRAPSSLVGQAIATNERVFATAVELAGRVTRGGDAEPLASYVVVTRLGGDHGLSGADPVAAWAGGCSGLAKTAAQEWSDVAVRSIQPASSEASNEACAALLASELFVGGVEVEVGLRPDGSRWTIEAASGTAPDGGAWFEEGDVVVVSGGARGVTAACVVALAEETGASFALLGRTRLSELDAAPGGGRRRDRKANPPRPRPSARGEA